MRKHATAIITPDSTTVLAGPLIVSPVSAHPHIGGGSLSLRPRGA